MTEREFRAAFLAHKDAVYRFAWRMTDSAAAAEDIAQDVFLALLKRPDSFDQPLSQLGFVKAGEVRGNTLTVTAGGDTIALECSGR